MSKFKYDIAKKNLSWEKLNPQLCENKGCKEKGSHKAPKSRSDLSEYYFFALNMFQNITNLGIFTKV